jgi:hypothetical protein
MTCRECGCTDERACVTNGTPCHWIDDDLCSTCASRPWDIPVTFAQLEFKPQDFEYISGFKSAKREIEFARKATDRANQILKRNFEKAQARPFGQELARRLRELDAQKANQSPSKI